jgi:hypothetical protein
MLSEEEGSKRGSPQGRNDRPPGRTAAVLCGKENIQNADTK